jgi:uncharacterized membrane protein
MHDPIASKNEHDVCASELVRSRRAAASLCAIVLTACTGIPRVELEHEQELVTGEDGRGVDISVRLAQRPSGVITIEARSSNEGEGRVSEPVVFDSHDWNVPQTVRVTGQDDDLDDGDQRFDVTFYARTSLHPERPALWAGALHFVNRDDELATFQALGDLAGGPYASYVSAMSAAGDVVVGWSEGSAGDEAVRFTDADGLRGLGGANSRALAVSPDGARIAGVVDDPINYTGRGAALWHDDGSLEVLRAPLLAPGATQYSFSLVSANVVLDDGRVFTSCYQYGVFWAIGCRYDGPGSLSPFPTEPFAADAAYNYAGRKNANRYYPIVYLSYDGTNLPYPTSACQTPGCGGEARAFSAGGALVVGTSSIRVGTNSSSAGPYYDAAWAWSAREGSRQLDDLDGGEEASGAYAISGDGRVIAGFGSAESGRTAVLWLDGTPTALADLFAEQGGTLPEGWTLLDVRAMSSDRRTFAGNGTNGSGDPEGYRLVLASAP